MLASIYHTTGSYGYYNGILRIFVLLKTSGLIGTNGLILMGLLEPISLGYICELKTGLNLTYEMIWRWMKREIHTIHIEPCDSDSESFIKIWSCPRGPQQVLAVLPLSQPAPIVPILRCWAPKNQKSTKNIREYSEDLIISYTSY